MLKKLTKVFIQQGNAKNWTNIDITRVLQFYTSDIVDASCDEVSIPTNTKVLHFSSNKGSEPNNRLDMGENTFKNQFYLQADIKTKRHYFVK